MNNQPKTPRNMTIPLYQTFSDATALLSYENVTVIGLLLFYLAYEMYQNFLLKKELKELTAKIEVVVAEHKVDLRSNNKTSVEMINRYHVFVEQMASVARANNHSSHHEKSRKDESYR